MDRKQPPARLTQQQVRFIEAYLAGGCANATQAALDAGFAPTSARGTGWRLLNRNALVMAEIEKRRQALADRTNRDLDAMLRQFDDDRRFAVETGNANAAVKASELTAKLLGHLVERRHVQAEGVVVQVVRFGDAAMPGEQGPVIDA